ncbi:MAG: hypothetical protein RLZZ385_1089 [Pseudomonadota bacterium]|jgi:membrane-bound lytic murein transglycosylase D
MAKSATLVQLSVVLCLLCLTGVVRGQNTDLFPRPAELEPAVQFWIRVYTEVDTQSGFLHDSQNLSVIYRRLPLDRTEIEKHRSQIQEDLKVLATGKRTGLTASQKDTLDKWPTGVTNATLAQAAATVRWQLGQSDRFLSGLQRSGAYRPHINQVIREKRLPLELGVLPHVESSFNPRAFSSASAAGMWQFGSATGKRFMRIDHIVDERMDPYTATAAAMSLLEYNYSILGTWPLALTAYNHGAGGMARAVREMGTDRIETIIANYKGRAFGFASRNFYPQFLAVLDVENNAKRYFGDVRFDPAPDFVEVTTDAFIDAEVLARSVGISLEQLRADNPALRPVVWEGSKRIPKGFPVKLRRQVAPEPHRLLAQIPADFKFGIQTPDVSYTVVKGDSLSVIARRFNTTVAQLVSLNQLASSHRIAIGQRLLLPQGADDQRLVLASSAALPVNAPEPKPEDGIYSVRRGDTVSLIAARFNVGEGELLRVNALQDPHRIYPGQQLTLPGFESSLQVIDANGVPQPPTEISYGDETAPLVAEAPASVESVVEIATVAQSEAPTSQSGAVAEPAEPELPEETIPPLQLALVDDGLSGTQALPDGEELNALETTLDEQAEAVEPALTVEQNNEVLRDALAADPSDYAVAADNTIEIQASETLGHYADWLGIQSWDIRRLNNMTYAEPVIIGKRLKLSFKDVSADQFEARRREFHLQQQQSFFASYRIQDVEHYKVKANDNLGSIARQRYQTPIWLLRQYNPDLDFARVQIGQEVVFPLLEAVN